jgi:tripartite-type tricarboxylate transporter receptor subunit TctC
MEAVLSSIIKTPYDPIRDFAPIAGIAVAPQVMVINPALRVNDG